VTAGREQVLYCDSGTWTSFVLWQRHVNKFCIVTAAREQVLYCDSGTPETKLKKTGLDSISASDVAEFVENPFGLFQFHFQVKYCHVTCNITLSRFLSWRRDLSTEFLLLMLPNMKYVPSQSYI